ncbi:TPA: hypothetical protein ACGXMF_003783 [Bacillus cereus]
MYQKSTKKKDKIGNTILSLAPGVNKRNNHHIEIGPNQRQPSFIEVGNSGFGIIKEYNEGKVESKDPGSN